MAQNESLKYEVGIDIPIMTDDDGSMVEIWPEFECVFCGSDEPLVRWEETSYESEDQARGEQQYYSGEKPCCCRCGSRVRAQRADSCRPEQWKQPILRVVSGIEGLSYSHRAVERIFDEYREDLRSFLSASPEELETIVGIGETFADRIYTRKAAHFPQLTPQINGHLYKFRGRRFREMDPARVARDLTIGFVDLADLPLDTDHEGEQFVLLEISDLLRENSDHEFWRNGKTSEEMVSLADEIQQKAKRKPPAGSN